MTLYRIAAPLIAASLALLAACGDGGSGATPVDTVIIEADDSEVAVGGTLQLDATAYDARGNEITGRSVSWSVNNSNVASISGSGVLTGNAPGTVQVTAEIGGQRDTQTFDVTNSFRGCSSTTYSIGQAVNGSLGTSDCEVMIEGEEKYVDVYRFSLAQSRGVVVGLFGRDDEFDAYLYLYDANGNLLAENDDFEPGTFDAGITRTLAAGEYYIVASSFATSDEAPAGHGPYTLNSGFSN